jgi:hypothetical protein
MIRPAPTVLKPRSTSSGDVIGASAASSAEVLSLPARDQKDLYVTSCREEFPNGATSGEAELKQA